MSEQKKTSELRRRELIELEHAWWNAMKSRDGLAAARLTDQTALYVGPQGVSEIDRAHMGDMVDKAKWRLERFDMDPTKLKIKMLTEDVALVAYEVDERVNYEGEIFRYRCYDSSVWVRKLGRWVCAMHTETFPGDPFTRRNKQSNGKEQRA
jgi:hypothetical protein